MTEHSLPRIEFGTDGIRGVAGEYPLDPETVLRIGRAIGRWVRVASALSKPNVIIGCDTRMSNHVLLHTLSAGLLAEGVYVDNVGVVTTPGIAYLARQRARDLGIMVSASHNPFEQNGIKLFGPDGFKLDDAKEEAVEALIAEFNSNSRSVSPGQFGSLSHEPYLDYLRTDFASTALQNISVVLDCANGASWDIAHQPFKHLGASQVYCLNNAPDGRNINVTAGSEYVRRDKSIMLAAIRASNADLGIAFDGDADRVVFVTPEGMLIDGDHTIGILALELQAQGKLTGDTVVVTDMSNSGLEHFLATHGIALIRTKVGDKYVMDRMRQGGFALGGEQAGHIIILDDDHTTGDGIYVGLLVASIVARNKERSGPTLYELASRIPRYPQVIASAHLNGRVDLVKVEGLEDLKAETLAAFDGKGRVNIRFSGTEPNLLRAMVEGGPQTSMQQVVDRSIRLCTLVAGATHTPRPVIDLVDCATGAPIKL